MWHWEEQRVCYLKKQIPENYNMDTQNDGLETGDSFQIWPLLGIYVKFLGCTPLKTNMTLEHHHF